MKQVNFFKAYQQDNEGEPMLKLKDWPPEEHFSKKLPRHNQVCLISLQLQVQHAIASINSCASHWQSSA